MNHKKDILEFSPEELKAYFSSLNKPTYRASQIIDWIYRKGVLSFEEMVNLSQEDREEFDSLFTIGSGSIHERHVSKEDKSIKLLVRMQDDQFAETVYIPRGNRRTVCVSSQVGCKFGCVFCASGQAGFGRQLTVGEVIHQVLLAVQESDIRRITHVVFMGMGEPFDNYEVMMKAIERLNHAECFNIGARRITVSTSGLVPKIKEFALKSKQVELSISLHGANDVVRGQLMPVNRKWPIRDLIETCKAYTKRTKRIVTFEYLLADGLNASLEDAKELCQLLKSIMCKVNLIPLNPIPEFPYKRPSIKDIRIFQRELMRNKIPATVRFSRGKDINAACGQLRRLSIGGKFLE